MRVPEPTRFCFCFDLKVGSFIIAIFSLVICIGNLLTWVSGVRTYQLSRLLYQLYNLDSCDEACHELVQHIVIWVALLILIMDGLHVVMCSLLIHGIRKQRPGLFTPFLSWQVTRLILSLCLFISLAIIFRQHVVLILTYLIIMAICWSLDLYFFLVIYAHKMEVSRAQGLEPLELGKQ